MHIMVANNIYPPIVAGGAERIVAYLCEGLVRRGHRVTVISTCGPEMEPYPVEIRNGVEVIRFFPPNLYWSFNRDRAPGFRKLLWHAQDAWNFRAAERVKAILATARPDILHTHLIDGFSASIWAVARRAGIRVVHTAHDYHLLCPRAFMLTRQWKLCTKPTVACRLFRSWHLRTTRYVDLFTSPSRFLLKIHENAGLQAQRCAVVHNGIPLMGDAERVRARRKPESRARFIMLSRLTVEKGVQVVLDAVAHLPKKVQCEIVIGGDGPLREVVEAAALKDSRIVFKGFLDGAAKTDALSRAGYLLLPSLWYENAPVTIIEAADYGLGIIGSNIGAIPEFVQPGQTGILFPPGDSVALAAAMKGVIDRPRALPALAATSRVFAESMTVDRMVENYQNHYLTLLDQKFTATAA